jgi:sulfofructose kinase
MAFRRVVGVGLSVIDESLLVDDFSFRTARIRYRERRVLPGGMVSTALAQAARLGCKSEILSVVGADSDGQFLARELRRLGIGTRRLLRSVEFPTTWALVLVNRRSGERRFVLPDRSAVERSAPDFDLSPITRGALVLIDGHYSAQALRAVRRARERGAVVIADFSDARPSYQRLLPFVDYPVLPREFADTWGAGSPRDTLLALRERYGGHPVITLGKRGALALCNGRVRRIPARRVAVRDTTGAGDIFHGAFAAGLYHGMEALQALGLAARAAALGCTALGGVGRLMSHREMEAARSTARASH